MTILRFPHADSFGVHLSATRRHVAVVRAIADELERSLADAWGLEPALREQLIHELARLGTQALEAAAAMAAEGHADPIEDSGVHRVDVSRTPVHP